MLFRFLVLLFVSTLFLTGCRSKKSVVTPKNRPTSEQVVIQDKNDPPPNVDISDTPTTVIKEPPANASYREIVIAYINNYKDIAQSEMAQYGIPASITLAQGILESGAGRGSLTKRANNHFGIKCHKGWTGERVYHDDDELQECFRKYKDPKYSFRDHSLFLTERSRYKDLFKLRKSDYKGWAKGLKKAGYATDPKYPNKLIKIIETYDLQQYDKGVIITGSDNTSNTQNETTYEVRKGDTLYSIAKRFKLSVEDLKKYNKLISNAIDVGQVLRINSAKN